MTDLNNIESRNVKALIRRIRILLVVFILGLFFSGVTTFALDTELGIFYNVLQRPSEHSGALYSSFYDWIMRISAGLHETNARYPYMAYGTDWLGFAHLVLALLFVGPLIDPVKNVWVITFGQIACVLVIPTALICGAIRGIPFYWQLIDCSFGVFGFVPLWIVRRDVSRLELVNDRKSAS